jgi:hypothetical protein
MKAAHILSLLWACATLAQAAVADKADSDKANAHQAAAHGGSSAAVAAPGQALGSQRAAPAAPVAQRRAMATRLTPTKPLRLTGQPAHTTMNRLHSPLSKPVRGRSSTPLISKTLPRGAAIGGPRTAPPARLGGPPILHAANTAAHTAAIDGTQVHPRF